MKPRTKREKQIPYRLKPQLLAWSIAACFATHAAWALPTGAQVAAGSASFNQLGNTLNIANTPGAIINWNNFSIGALEAVRFQQQNSLSAVLNRVTGTTSSAIHGALSSNGRVFLINPNGILFGAGSRVDVNGLIASTLNLSDRDFLAGRLNFTAGNLAGGIQNAGSLQANAGNIYLIAPDIANSGIVHAPNGEVLLAAGRQVSLVDAAHPDIQVVVSAPGDKAVNLGELVAGKISVFGALIQQKGIASADTVAVDDHGRIVFRATQQLDVATGSRTTANGAAGGTVALQSAGDTYVSGSIAAQGNVGAGGTAQVLGNRVAVMDAASIDTSGATGGGSIMVGGDYRGGNSAVQNAQITYFGPHASLKANATKVGAGGTVIVWADDTTRAHGRIEARGGAEGGDGGFVETSGKQHLDFRARIDTRADNGRAGTVLLDPDELAIADGGGPNANDGEVGPVDGELLATTGSGTYTLSEQAIEGIQSGAILLQANNSITLNDLTDGQLTLYDGVTSFTLQTMGGSGGISFVDANDEIYSYNTHPITGADISLIAGDTGSLSNIGKITSSSGGTGGAITLTAGGAIDLKNDISSNGDWSGNIAITAGGTLSTLANKNIDGNDVTLKADIMALQGSVSANAALRIETYTAGNSIDLGSTANNTANTLEISDAELDLFSAPKVVLATTGAGNITVSAITTVPANISTLSLDSLGNVTQASGATVATAGALELIGKTVDFPEANSVPSLSGQIKTASGDPGDFVFNTTDNLNIVSPGISVQLGSYSYAPANQHGVISLTTTTAGSISQAASAYLSGAAIQASSYGGVILDKANPTGVIAGYVSDTGDFKFNSTSAIHVAQVAGVTGIEVPGFIRLETSSGGTAFTQTAPLIAPAGLLLAGTGASQSVALKHASNNFSTFAINLASASTVGISQGGTVAMAVATVDGTAGLNAPGATKLEITNTNVDGSLTFNIGQAVTVGATASVELASGSAGITIAQLLSAKNFSLRTDGTISLTAALTASDWVHLSNYTADGTFMVDGNCSGSCINPADFAYITAPTGIAFGSNDVHPTSSLQINAAIDTTNDFAGAPAFIALLSGPASTININAPITLPAEIGYFVFDGGTITNTLANAVSASYVSGKATSATLYFTGVDTSIASFTTLDSTPVTYGGITTTGNLWMSHGSSNRFLNGGGILAAPTWTVIAGSIGTAADKLVTQLDTLTFTAQGEGAFITNHTAAVPGAMSITGTANSSAPSGSVIISNYGATTIAAGGISADGSITVTANSPLTVAGAVTSTAGSVGLTSSNGDALTINSNVSASTGVSLTAGSGGTLSVTGGSAVTTSTGTLTLAAGSVAGSGTVGGIVATSASFTSTTPPPSTPVTPPPTVDACVANPSLTGCSTVLPTLDACVINPTAAGCSAVLPSVDACVANPTAAGCSTVLPPLATCTTAPSTPGCSAVLPTVDACVANPTATGCSSVLPSLATCATAPSTAGCSAVLPTVDACVANPTAAGCSSVLPSLATCATAPSTAGCSAVLPTVDACVANPVAAGCSSVLPPLATCATAPATPGCSAVLPTVGACVANPTAAGCSSVLPPLATCATAPSTPGCSAVLPTVSACVANPTAAGCSSVLPPLAACTAAPATPGCSAVLPAPTLPSDQQLACLLDPAACAPGSTTRPTDTAQPILQQLQSSEQQLVLNSQIGQSDSGRPDLALMQTSSSSSPAPAASGGGGAASSTPGGTNQSAGEAQGRSGDQQSEDEQEQDQQNAGNNTPQGATNAPPQRRYCN